VCSDFAGARVLAWITRAHRVLRRARNGQDGADSHQARNQDASCEAHGNPLGHDPGVGVGLIAGLPPADGSEVAPAVGAGGDEVLWTCGSLLLQPAVSAKARPMHERIEDSFFMNSS